MLSEMFPDILFIVIDCLRADTCYGEQGRSKIPNLRKLTDTGSVFKRNYATATTTVPSFYSMLTGLYPYRHRVHSLKESRTDSRAAFLQEALKEKGYHTYAEVTGPLVEYRDLRRGFDVYHHRDRHTYFNSVWGEEFLKSIQDYRTPWFSLLHLWELHHSYKYDTEHRGPRYGSTHYERALSSLDVQLGRILDAVDLDKTVLVITGDHGELLNDRFEDYRFVNRIWRRYMSATYRVLNGLTGGHRKPRFRGHGFDVSECLIRVPLIIWGGGPSKQTSDDVTSHVDIVPTLLNMVTSGEGGMDVDGIPLIPNQRHTRERLVYFEAMDSTILDREDYRVGFNHQGYKYVRNPFDGEADADLFHIVDDPDGKRRSRTIDGEIRDRFDREFDKICPLLLPDEDGEAEGEEVILKNLRDLGYL